MSLHIEQIKLVLDGSSAPIGLPPQEYGSLSVSRDSEISGKAVSLREPRQCARCDIYSVDVVVVSSPWSFVTGGHEEDTFPIWHEFGAIKDLIFVVGLSWNMRRKREQ